MEVRLMDKAVSRLALASALLGTLLAPTAWTLDSGAERAVRSATFEFFAPGLTPGSKGLVATAFAIGPNQFVTAAHLLNTVIGSRFGHPVLLDSANVSYEIADILQFSEQRDYVVFSLQHPPRVRPLPIRHREETSSDLYFAGWRPGKSIVIERAKFEGMTQDAESHQFDWLSFSGQIWGAVGGGPLLDEAGTVVGIVQASSRNGSDTHFAAPIELLPTGAPETAHIHETDVLRALMPAVTNPMPLEAEIALPKSFAEFSQELGQLRLEYFDRAVRPLLEATRHNFVLTGEGSSDVCDLLNGRACQCKPTHGVSGELVVDDAQAAELARRLSAGEEVSQKVAGSMLIRLRAHDDARSNRHDPMSDPGAHLKLALKGAGAASRALDITPDLASVADSQEDEAFTDFHGRIWRLRAWSLSDRDLAVISLVRKLPNGYTVLTRTAPTALVYAVRMQLQFVANIVYYGCEEQAQQGDERMASNGSSFSNASSSASALTLESSEE
jgi:serine protease Do